MMNENIETFKEAIELLIGIYHNEMKILENKLPNSIGCEYPSIFRQIEIFKRVIKDLSTILIKT